MMKLSEVSDRFSFMSKDVRNSSIFFLFYCQYLTKFPKSKFYNSI